MTASYDSQKVQDLVATPSQWGRSTSSAAWSEVEIGVGLHLARTNWPGASFDFNISSDGERGLVLAPRIPFTAVTQDLAGTGETSHYWTLVYQTNVTSPANADIELYAVNNPTPDIWFEEDNYPELNLATLNETYLLDILTPTDAGWVWNTDRSQYDMVFQLDFVANYSESVAGATLIAPLSQTVNHPLWNGLLQFFLDTDGPLLMLMFGAAFSGKTQNWHTGMIGEQMNVRGRAVHDQITGQPYMSHIAVADGYRDGVMVHPDNFDPADPLEENPWTPPPGEGVTDDDLIDVE